MFAFNFNLAATTRTAFDGVEFVSDMDQLMNINMEEIDEEDLDEMNLAGGVLRRSTLLDFDCPPPQSDKISHIIDTVDFHINTVNLRSYSISVLSSPISMLSSYGHLPYRS
jgi:hypothetical protein